MGLYIRRVGSTVTPAETNIYPNWRYMTVCFINIEILEKGNKTQFIKNLGLCGNPGLKSKPAKFKRLNLMSNDFKVLQIEI